MEEDISIITLGQSAVGKTSIIKRIIHNTYEETTKITISLEFHSLTKDYKNKSFNKIKYQFSDTAGGEIYNSLTMNYIRGKDIVLLIFCDLNSLEVLIKRWYSFIKDNSDISKTKFIVVANKSDTFGDKYDDIKKKVKSLLEIFMHFSLLVQQKAKKT